MTKLRLLAFGYGVAVLAAASLNYVPGLTDSEGARSVYSRSTSMTIFSMWPRRYGRFLQP